jgi:DNA (cytosine-5)-methyltransferase 1
MRCVEDLLPRAFVLENVYGISYSGKEEGFHFLEREITRINKRQKTNYTISWKVINTAHYGVPQIRERFFLVAHRDGKRFSFPEPTHGDPVGSSLFDAERLPYVTAWDALSSVTPETNEDLHVRGYWADLLPSIPEGENYLWHTPRKGGVPLFGWRSRYWSFLLKLAKNKPSWTIQAQPGPAIGPFHWENRLLSVRELANIQTFPQDVHFVGTRNAIQRQLGNAVPSLIAEILGREILKQFFGQTTSKKPTLAVEPKRPIPPADPVKAVPTKFKRPAKEEVADYVPRYLRKGRTKDDDSVLADAL